MWVTESSAAAWEATDSGVSHRSTPTLPEPSAGLSTTGNSVAAATAAATDVTTVHFGAIAASAARWWALLRQSVTASGSGPGRSSFAAIRAATGMKYSELVVTPAGSPMSAARTAHASAVSHRTTRTPASAAYG